MCDKCFVPGRLEAIRRGEISDDYGELWQNSEVRDSALLIASALIARCSPCRDGEPEVEVYDVDPEDTPVKVWVDCNHPARNRVEYVFDQISDGSSLIPFYEIRPATDDEIQRFCD